MLKYFYKFIFNNKEGSFFLLFLMICCEYINHYQLKILSKLPQIKDYLKPANI
jgi:hypothetical protein